MSPGTNSTNESPSPSNRAGRSGGSDGGMSTLTIVLIIGGILGVSALICIGFGVYIVYEVEVSEYEEPDAIVEVTDSIADIEIPEQFEPEAAIRTDMVIMAIEVVRWEHSEAEGTLLLADAEVSGSVPLDQARQDLEDELEPGLVDDGVARDFETRDIEIRGTHTPVDFETVAAPETGEKYRVVEAEMPTEDRGLARLHLTVAESIYDEDEVLQMLESIR